MLISIFVFTNTDNRHITFIKYVHVLFQQYTQNHIILYIWQNPAIIKLKFKGAAGYGLCIKVSFTFPRIFFTLRDYFTDLWSWFFIAGLAILNVSVWGLSQQTFQNCSFKKRKRLECIF